MIIDLVYEKLNTRRNKLFLLVFLLLQGFFVVLSLTEGINAIDLENIQIVNSSFFYIFILVVLSGEMSSGFLSKQLSNGLSRNKATALNQVSIFILAILFWIISTAIIFTISAFIIKMPTLPFQYLYSIFGFVLLSQLAFILSSLFEKSTNAVLISYFLIKGFDNFAFNMITKVSDSKIAYILPHSLAANYQNIYENNGFDIGTVVLAFYILLLPVIVHFRMKKINFTN